MRPIKKTKAELVELAERLRAIAKVLKHFPPDHPVSAKSIDYLRKQIRDIAAQLR